MDWLGWLKSIIRNNFRYLLIAAIEVAPVGEALVEQGQVIFKLEQAAAVE